MRILFAGLLGSGKTLMMTIFGYDEKKHLNRKVVANYKVSFADEIINPNDLLNFELENCILLLDELEVICDSRLNRNANRLLSYFFFQSRKRDVDIIGTSQLLQAVDLRMRFITDYDFYCEGVYADLFRKKPIQFNYTMYSQHVYINHFSIDAKKAYPFMKMYNTKEVIYPVDNLQQGAGLNMGELEELMEESPTKKVFVMLLRKLNPYVTVDIANAVYDSLKIGNIKQVERLIR